MNQITIIKFDDGDYYTKLPNKLLQNEKMSYEAKGLLGELLSRPSNWIIQKEQLIRDYAKRDKLTRIINELKDFGYMFLWTKHDSATGKFSYRRWIVSFSQRSVEEFNKFIQSFENIDNLPIDGKSVDGLNPDTDLPIDGLPVEGENPRRGNQQLQIIYKDLLQTIDPLQKHISEPEKNGSENGDLNFKKTKEHPPKSSLEGGLKSKKEDPHICKDGEKCLKCDWHVKMFGKSHEKNTGLPYAFEAADWGQAKRIHKVYSCSQLIDFQKAFWRKYREEPDAWSSKRLSFTVFVSAIKSLIPELTRPAIVDERDRPKPWDIATAMSRERRKQQA
jgi:hypothetical protein